MQAVHGHSQGQTLQGGMRQCDSPPRRGWQDSAASEFESLAPTERCIHAIATGNMRPTWQEARRTGANSIPVNWTPPQAV